jgi:hypothetical protein
MSTETVEALRGSGVQKRLRGGPATKGDDAPFAVDGTHYPQSLEAIKPRRDRRRSDGGIRQVGLKRANLPPRGSAISVHSMNTYVQPWGRQD